MATFQEGLHAARPDVTTVLTGMEAEVAAKGLRLLRALPPGRAGARAVAGLGPLAAFAQVGGPFDPGLHGELARMDLPRIALGLGSEDALLTAGGWRPGLRRQVFAGLAAALVVDGQAAERLERAGLPTRRIRIAGTLGEIPTVLPCIESDRADMARALGTRPVWLAADLPGEEVAYVEAAYRLATRQAHRLMLIAAPPEEGAAVDRLAEALAARGLRIARRDAGEEPQEDTEVYLADGPGELGLWLRLAPVTYLGGTLTRGPQRSPYTVASLGSALIHGPKRGGFDVDFTRLLAQGGARAVRQSVGLGPALAELLAPDRAARLAHAAWDVASEGADAMAAAVETVLAQLPEPA